MELLRKNIHMDCIKNKTVIQTTIEDDVNISDAKPDVTSVLLEKGELVFDEIKVTQDHVLLRGKLQYAFLYSSVEGERQLYEMKGAIHFEEHVNMDGVRAGDDVTVFYVMEDLSVTLINSRKVSIRSLNSITLSACTMKDISVPVEIKDNNHLEYRHNRIETLELAVMKKDVFRMKDEIEIPKSLPNIQEIVWDQVSLNWIDFRMQDGKIGVQGEVNVFFLYEGVGDGGPLRYYENMHSFSSSIPCSEAKEGMIPLISHKVSGKEITVREDYDGEERIVGIDMNIDLDIKAYEEIKTGMISDIYGVSHDVLCTVSNVNFKNLVTRNTLKQRMVERMRVAGEDNRIMQILHSRGEVIVDEMEVVEDGIRVEGSVGVFILYISNDDNDAYHTIRGNIPFSYVIDAVGITPECSFDVVPSVEQINVMMVDSEQVDVKLVLSFLTTVFKYKEADVIEELDMKELDIKTVNELPGMVIYVVKEGDTLWQIGKKYYVPVERIKELNGLTTDEIMPGDKLLIVKEFI